VASLSVVAYISQVFQDLGPNTEMIVTNNSKVSNIFRYLRDTTKVLSVLASSISTGVPLPPELQIGVAIEEDTAALKGGRKSVDLHVLLDPGVEALNAIEITAAQVTRSVGRIHIEVRKLVGEILF
jgi:hypothetical protein